MPRQGRAWLLGALFVLSPVVETAYAAERRSPVVIAVERAAPAVVGVRVQVMVSRGASPFDSFFENFFGPLPQPSQRRETRSQGSGVIISPEGTVLTNYHVVASAGDIEIELRDGRVLPVDVVGASPEHDLAVLRAQSKDPLPHLPMGKSGDLLIGETVIAIGNPFGLQHTVTTGVISALHRSIKANERTYSDFIQTDASINPGNSGGPLLNIDGELIGVNTAIFDRAQGIGFAIPIDKAQRIVRDLVRHGEVRRPYYGFEIQDVTPALAQSFGLPEARGGLVAEVDPKGPSHGRLREGDVILRVGELRVADAEELRLYLADYTVGAQVVLEVARAGKNERVTVQPIELDPKAGLQRFRTKTGLDVVELDADQARRARLPEGTLLIRSVARGSQGARAGIRAGDWLRAVNSQRVLGLSALGKAMARCFLRGEVILLIQRGAVWQQIAFAI